MSGGPVALPRWIDLVVLPAFNLALALAVCGVVVWGIGLSPLPVLGAWVKGAFGSALNLSYTLYYATTFTFTGLAVAVAFHGGQFNIGGEGQAMLGSLGAALAALALADHLPAWAMLPLMVASAAAFGMVWAAVPAALQVWRGSHVVITTIMFNFIASALLAYLLVNVLKEPGNMTVESRGFASSGHMPGMDVALGWLGIEWPRTPLNLSLLLALAAALGVWALLWRSRLGYAVRAVGHSPAAAAYGGIRTRWVVLGSMALAGALAGLVGVNEIAGVHHRLLLDVVVGAGFAGIAVSLIGRNHPVGILLAALLFGALYQGGAELTFEVPGFSRDMVITLQGLIVLFCGAMSQVAAPVFARAWAAWQVRRVAAPAQEARDG